ncbi:MAG TPA: penicillin-binding transpeptidase domain-containing protein, partial [Steroidobacteraceae bacterium]|nr:penicillin-binding transpeptidase domain-containing protein [Steroidobacteraceae bacterium]
TLDKSYRRKLQETFVTYEMEHEFTKEEILGLYLNVIFLGQRAYGVTAAAETYFGKSLDQLTVAEAATIAGLPKAPSQYNPIINPQLATGRRSYVLRRMVDVRFIDAATAEAANKEPMQARAHGPLFDVEAPYIAEMARLQVRQQFGIAAESAGYKVYTTIDGRLQAAANRAVRIGLIEYDRRHGFRGPVGHVNVAPEGRPEQLDGLVDEYSTVGVLSPAVVVSVAEKTVRVYVKTRGFAQIDWDGMSWARKAAAAGEALGPPPKTASDVVAKGDVVYVVANSNGVAQLGQIPEAQSALVSLDPEDGGVSALVGGFDYFTNKYNRVIQARRLPGSGFKPFLYSAALENGFTPASVLLDAPVVMEGDGIEASWRPENSHGDFSGPMRLREALVKSRNLVSIRLLRELGTPLAIDYVTRFGFDKRALPQNLTLALGTVQSTPMEVATGYSVFANGGFRVMPYFIDRIENGAGQVVWQAKPRVACEACERPVDLGDLVLTNNAQENLQNADTLRGGRGPLAPDQIAERVISPQNAYLMTDMMADVIKRGTAVRARSLGRSDIAGKTGTTNEAKDTWFNGFTPNLVATVWVGYDQERPLGEREEGARTALPIWIHFMREALKGVPDKRRPMPEGLVQLRVSARTGALVGAENPDGFMETFMADHLPAGNEGSVAQGAEGGAQSSEPIF